LGTTISTHSIVVASRDQVSCELAGEAAVLDVKKGAYYGLDAVGAYVWTLLKEPRSVSEIQLAIAQEYDVDPEQCKRDVLALLAQMEGEGLIDVKKDKQQT
jgi:hypothetical protein